MLCDQGIYRGTEVDEGTKQKSNNCQLIGSSTNRRGKNQESSLACRVIRCTLYANFENKEVGYVEKVFKRNRKI